MTTYYRRISFRPADGRIEAEMQDHCHHMKVAIACSGGVITEATSEGVRLPWQTCAIGIAGVGQLSGEQVQDAHQVTNWPGGRTANCLHTADLTVLALGHLHDTTPLTYLVTVTPATGRVRTARLLRDGELSGEWVLEDNVLRAPAKHAGRSFTRADFNAWTAELDPADREAAVIVRRAFYIAPSRDVNLDQMRVAADSIAPDPSCYTLQPSVIGTARRIRGSSRAVLTD